MPQTEQNRARLKIRVAGLVQDVGFRWAAVRQAQALGLTGWARNLADGGVEIVAEGARTALDAMLAWAGDGPAAARVDKVDADWDEFRGEFSRFELRR
jgi:acylphosphatase